MKAKFNNLNLNQKLALTVAVIGFFAVFAGSPYVGPRVMIASDELATIVQKEVDHVDPRELADWIIQGKIDYRLLDLRDEESSQSYNIPTSERVPITELDSYPLARNEKIVLYSDGGIHSAQAWFLLKARGYRGVYIVKGGLEGWKDQVLFPSLSTEAGAEQKADFEKARSVAEFFGGRPRTGSSEAKAADLTMPKLDMPAPIAPVGGAKKKKKEGC